MFQAALTSSIACLVMITWTLVKIALIQTLQNGIFLFLLWIQGKHFNTTG